MAKMTKTQKKRAYLAIKQKARSLWGASDYTSLPQRVEMSSQDMMTIEKICDKYLKKF